MNIQKINSQKEFQDICQEKFDGFRAKYSTGYYIAGFPSENLYKGINCTHVIESYAESDALLNSEYYILTEQGEFKDDGHAAILPVNSDERFYGIIGNDRYISLDLTMHRIYMKQATPEGVYELSVNTRPNFSIYPTHVYFHSNEDILNYMKEAGYGQEEAKSNFDIIKFRFAHDGGKYLGNKLPSEWESLPSLKVNLSTGEPTDEFVMLANKIYRKGLPYVASLARTGGVLEITDEDRKFFEEASKQTEETVAQVGISEESQVANSLVEPTRNVTVEQRESTHTSDLEGAIQALRSLSSSGFELTDSQKDLIAAYDRLIDKLNSQKFMWYYDKLRSDEFQQYKAGAQERE